MAAPRRRSRELALQALYEMDVGAHEPALALERLIGKPDENLVLNCGYGKGLSVVEVLDALDRVLGRPVPRRAMPRRAGDPPLLVAANRALIETLEWRPRFGDIETIIRHALEWERKLQDRS